MVGCCHRQLFRLIFLRLSSSRSIASVTAWRHDGSEFVEVEFDNRLQRHGCGRVAEAVGQCVGPGGVFGLQGEQFGDGIAPALRPGAPIGWPSIADHRRSLLCLVVGTIAGLPFGVAEWLLSLGLSPLWISILMLLSLSNARV